MIEVPSSLRSSQPYLSVGVVVVTWPDGTRSRGTASLVGRNDVLTAGHVVYSPDHGGWATAYSFSFGADYNSVASRYDDIGFRPTFSRWDVLAWTSGLYVDGSNGTMLYSETQYDVALIGIDNPIGDKLGWLDLSAGYEGTQTAVAIGYPAGSTGMMAESVTVTASPVWGVYTSSNVVMGPGSSGGPLLVGNTVIGVKSTYVSWADLDFVWPDLVARLSANDRLLTQSDTTPPIVIAWSPAADAFASRSDNIVVTFDEPVRRGSGNIVLKTAAGATVETFDAAASSRLAIDGATLTIDPTADFAHDTAYVVQFDAGSIRDAAGNGYAGTAAYNFRTMRAPTNGDDMLTASSGPDTIDGLAGDDTINGAGGNDSLKGGAGDDTLTGGSGDDSLEGGEGTDIAAFSGAYRDHEISSLYSIVSLGELKLTLLGYEVSSMGEGTDSVSPDVELLRFADGVAILSDGSVTFLVPHLTGTSAADTLPGTPLGENILGMGGDDTLIGGGGDDSLFGGSGDDSALYRVDYTGATIAPVYGGRLGGLTGHRIVAGSEGADFIGTDVERVVFADGVASLDAGVVRFQSSLQAIHGSAGADLIEGTDGREAIYAGGGDDVLIGSAGNDHLYGGDGVDLVSYPGAAPFNAVAAAADGSMTLSHATFGTDMLSGIERIRFTDTWYANDTSGSAGVAARTVIAILGVSGVPVHLDAVLNFTDRGYTARQLSELAASARLVERTIGSDADGDFVARVFANAVGRAPSSDEAAYYVGLLETGASTRADLLELAAAAPSTAMLMQTATVELLGIAYQPPAA